VFFSHIRCPRCLKPTDSRFFHINTGLGPKTIQCPKCLTEVGTGRREWDEFGGGRRFLYYFLTVLYAAVYAVLGGAAADVAYRGTPSLGEGSPSIFGLKLFPTITVGLVFALLVVLVQIYRVKASRARLAAVPRPLINAGFFNLQARLQPKFFLIFVLVFFAGISPFVYGEAKALYLKSLKPGGKAVPVKAIPKPALPKPVAPVTPATPPVAVPESPKPVEPPPTTTVPSATPVTPPAEPPKPAPPPEEPPKPDVTLPTPPSQPAAPAEPEPKVTPPVATEIQPLPVIPPEPKPETPKTDSQPVAPPVEKPVEIPPTAN